MTRKRRNNTAVVRLPGEAHGVEVLVPLIEASWSDADAKAALEERIAAARPGTRAAANLVHAADSIEDGDLLFHMAGRGLAEAFTAHTLRALIVSESQAVIEALADAVATAVSGPEETVSVSIATVLVAGRVAEALGLVALRSQVASVLEERFGPMIQANVGNDATPGASVSVAPAVPVRP